MTEKEKLTMAQLQNRQRLFDGAEPLFVRLGFKKTTIQDVCQAAGMSKPTFYDLFKDKGDLFVQMMVSISEKAILIWEKELPKNANPMKKLLSFFDFYADLYRSKPIFRSFYLDPEIMEKFAGMFYSTPESPLLTLLREILHDGVVSGHFRNHNPETVLWMIYSLLDTMYMMIPMFTGKPGPADDPKFAKEINQFILKGIGAYND